MNKQPHLLAALVVFSALTLGCSGDMWRSCTAAVVGKTVETSKEVGTGIVEGIQDGRKAGESVDGAAIVSSLAELNGLGTATLYSVEPGPSDGTSTVTIAIENTGEKPLRVTEISIDLLDDEGFVQRPQDKNSRELTVPPHAKDRASAVFGVPPRKVGEVRLWGQPLAK